MRQDYLNDVRAGRLETVAQLSIVSDGEEKLPTQMPFDDDVSSVDRIEVEAQRRVLDGAPAEVISANSRMTNPTTGSSLVARKYSDALLIMLLKANRASRHGVASKIGEDEAIRAIAEDPDPPCAMRGKGS